VYYLAYNDDVDIIENNKVLCYFTDFGSFTKYTGWLINDFLLNSDGNIEIASRNYSLSTESDTFLDIDVDTGETKDIVMDIESAELTFDLIENPKFFDKAFVHFVQTDDDETSLVDIDVKIGSGSQSFKDVDTAPSLIWGKNWGSLWGFEPLFFYFAYLRRKGVWIKYRITSTTGGSPIEFYGVTFTYQALRKHTNSFLGTPI